MRTPKLIDGKCKELIFDNFSPYQCSRKAVEDGYCKQHSPGRVAARQKERNDKWEKEWRDREIKQKIKQKESEAIEVVRRIAEGLDDPKETAQTFIRELNEISNMGIR